MSGLLNPLPDAPATLRLAQVRQAAALADARRPRLCYVATAMGDDPARIDRWYSFAPLIGDAELSHLALFPQPNVTDVRSHLLAQDALIVAGGSVVNLLAVWRAHRLDEILHECWDAGVVLAGESAGSLCWHLGGPTDSYRDGLDPFTDGLALLPHSNGVHDDLADQPRRERYRAWVAAGTLPAGYATEDGVGLHYIDTHLQRVIAVAPDRNAWHVSRDPAGGHVERRLPAEVWIPDLLRC